MSPHNRYLLTLLILLLPTVAAAKVNPTITARSCLTRAIEAQTDARACFTDAGWKSAGEKFIAQQKRKGWTVEAGDESSCCTAPVLWAEVVLRKAGRVVDRVFLILKKTNGTLRIDALTEKDPRPTRPKKR